MPELSRFYGIIIKMYFSDHNPPHFHAEYESYKAEYEIKTLDRIAGILPSRAHALVLEWASLHKDELLTNWEQAQVPATLNKIEPLK
jgi:hypothetical protein